MKTLESIAYVVVAIFFLAMISITNAATISDGNYLTEAYTIEASGTITKDNNYTSFISIGEPVTQREIKDGNYSTNLGFLNELFIVLITPETPPTPGPEGPGGGGGGITGPTKDYDYNFLKSTASDSIVFINETKNLKKFFLTLENLSSEVIRPKIGFSENLKNFVIEVSAQETINSREIVLFEYAFINDGSIKEPINGTIIITLEENTKEKHVLPLQLKKFELISFQAGLMFLAGDAGLWAIGLVIACFFLFILLKKRKKSVKLLEAIPE